MGNVALVVPFCAVMGRIAGFGAGVGPFDLGFMDERPVYVLCGWAARASIRGELAGGMSRLPVFVATSYRLNLIRTTSFPQKCNVVTACTALSFSLAVAQREVRSWGPASVLCGDAGCSVQLCVDAWLVEVHRAAARAATNLCCEGEP